MAWLELHQSIRDHRKVVIAADALSIPEPHLVGHIAYLWLWALDNAPDGLLPSDRVVARAAWWTGDPSEFVGALVEANLLDRCDDDLSIHNWDEYAGKLIDRRESNRERQARHRDKNRSSNPRNGDITVTSQSRNGATEHNRTQQNTTEPVPLLDSPAPIPAQPETTPKRRRQIPEDWEPSELGRAYAAKHGMAPGDVEQQVCQFRNSHRGKGNVFADIDAAWRTWCDRYLQFQPRAPAKRGSGSGVNGRMTPDDFFRMAQESLREQG